MNISHPISVHRAIMQERRESRKSIKKTRSNHVVIPLPDDRMEATDTIELNKKHTDYQDK